MNTRRIARFVLLGGGTLTGVLSLELAFRLLDHQPLTRVALVSASPQEAGPPAPTESPALKYVDRVPLADDVDRRWYGEEPAARTPFQLDGQLAARAAQYPADPYTPFFAFNRQYLEKQLCGNRRSPPGGLQEFFFFEPPDGQSYPTYRHLAHINPPSWFVTNNFGWRGPDGELNRPAQVIRLAFVGASTTVGGYAMPFSYPELIERWLNLWATRRGLEVRFEGINAGRTGIDSRSIAGIVKEELVPVDPDLVVFYEGANQFAPGSVLHSPFRRVFPKPVVTFRERTALERYSALVRRLLSGWDRIRGHSGEEPTKPPAILDWPSGVDELAPDPHDPRLPMELPQVVHDLDDMRRALEPIGSTLAVSSFIWLAYPGLKLDPVRHSGIYRYLNDTLWPISYAHVRRMADFQNRAFAAYARESGAPFIDVHAEFPPDPDLFDDPIHLTYAGVRLQGWIFLQHLVRIIEQRLNERRWPRPSKPLRAVHPAFSQPARRLVTIAEIAAHCS
jgi:hypothetical protein